MSTLFFQFDRVECLFLFSSVLCAAWIVLDLYNSVLKDSRWSKYWVTALAVVQGCIAAGYVFCDERRQVFVGILVCTGIYAVIRSGRKARRKK